MRRDIKLENMGVESLKPLEVFIFDFGCATSEKTSPDHGKGTIRYLATEVMKLKQGEAKEPYDKAIDVWSMGLCALELLYRVRWEGKTTERLGAIIHNNTNHVILELKRPISQMLLENPRDRISAKDAMSAFSDFLRRPHNETAAQSQSKKSKA